MNLERKPCLADPCDCDDQSNCVYRAPEKLAEAERANEVIRQTAGEAKCALTSLKQQVERLVKELKHAQAIIDDLKAWREAWLTRPHKSTPEMRARIRELAIGRDDFDRAVLMLLDDFEAEEKARAQNA